MMIPLIAKNGDTVGEVDGNDPKIANQELIQSGGIIYRFKALPSPQFVEAAMPPGTQV